MIIQLTRNTVLGLAVGVIAIGGATAYALSGSPAPTKSPAAVATHSAPVREVTSPTTTVPQAPLTTTTPTTSPLIAQQALIAHDSAAVANDEALLQQDESTIQTLTTQHQTLQGAATEATAQGQGQVQQLEATGQATPANLEALEAQEQAADAASEQRLDAVVGALTTAESKYGQDQVTLAGAEVALQVAQDVASTTAG